MFVNTALHTGNNSCPASSTKPQICGFLFCKMVELDAAKVLTIPKTIKAKEVIRRGFMSNFLFQNIGNIFSAPAAVRDVLQKLTPAEEQADKKNDLSMNDAESVSVDENGEVDVPQDIVVQKSSELFGKKIYEDVTRETQGLIDDAAKNETPSPLAEVADAVAETLVQNLRRRLTPTSKMPTA